jgi:hypothetical protein
MSAVSRLSFQLRKNLCAAGTAALRQNQSSVLPLDGRTSLASLSVGGDLWMMGRSYSGLRRCHDGEGQPWFSRLLQDSASLAAEHDGEISRVEAAMPEEGAGRLAVLLVLLVLRQVHVETQAPR